MALLGVLSAATPATAAPTAATSPPVWQTTWTSPTDLAVGYTYNSTTRDIATVAVSGDALTFTFSNLWSSTPTTFAAVTVGVQQSGPDVVAGTLRAVTFDHGSHSITIGPHARVTSDAVAMRVHAGETLAVSVAVTGYASKYAIRLLTKPVPSPSPTERPRPRRYGRASRRRSLSLGGREPHLRQAPGAFPPRIRRFPGETRPPVP